MLDINLIINHSSDIKNKLLSRGYELSLNKLEDLYFRRKDIIKKKEDLAANKNQISDQFKTCKDESEREKLRTSSENLENEIQLNKDQLLEIENNLKNILLDIPNIPLDDVPKGKDFSDNQIIKTWGEPSKDIENDHSELFESNKLLDFELSVKVSKSRFSVLKGKLARLSRSLISYCLNHHIEINGYTEYYTPYIVNKNSLIGTGQLPKFEEDLFKIHGEELYLIPTAEVPLTNLYRDTIIDQKSLPLKLVSHTPCFRSEAGSYGKDTRGIIRQHQFEKVEVVQIVEPEHSLNALEEITSHAEQLLENLEVPYQRVCLSTGDLGFSASKTYDIEAWFPGEQTYREVSSCSLFGDFQSRRANIKFKSSDKKKYYPHTLNGSALAIGRTLAAIIENHTKDNIIHIPDVLRVYTGFDSIKL